MKCESLGGDVCPMTCFLQYSKIGDEEFLEGTYTSMNMRDSSNCGKGIVFLRKVPVSDFYEEPFVEKRENEIAENKKTEKSLLLKSKKIIPLSLLRNQITHFKKPTDITKKPGVKKDCNIFYNFSTIKKKTKSPAGKKTGST